MIFESLTNEQLIKAFEVGIKKHTDAMNKGDKIGAYLIELKINQIAAECQYRLSTQ